MNFQECDLGFTFKNSKVCIFFGKSNCNFESLQNNFKLFEFFQIQQTHSDIIVEAGPSLQTADAHWTSQRNKALVIRTADCIPAFIYNSHAEVVAGIHAGWRGVENQIVLKSLKNIYKSCDLRSGVEIWIGPHILQPSFEVDQEVMQKLINSCYHCSQEEIAFPQGEKYMINLKKIVETQIAESKILNIQSHELALDTKTNQKFHSFRRDGIHAGRNLSFISLISTKV